MPVNDNEDIARQAADWMVRLSDDDEIARDRAKSAYLAWQKQDARHEAAAREIEGVLGRLQALRDTAAGSAQPARVAMRAGLRARVVSKSRARAAAIVVAVACGVAGPGWLVLQAVPLSYLVADIKTGAGEWTTQVLEDGTRISLDARSAINVRYDTRFRTVQLVRGRVRVDVARDASRPFSVETAFARLQALGTRFVVDAHDESTLMEVIESRVVATPLRTDGAGGQAVIVTAGQRVRISSLGIGTVESVDATSIDAGWNQRRLIATDLPLTEVLDTLARFHTGRLVYDRAAMTHLRVNAVLPLDDTAQALRLLQSSFPMLRVRTMTPWWVHIGTQP
ncbi:FecR family protein [Pigmentiphaga litoralis]|uniref:FecR family protein n=1 Tax=Pigmentiphaga litoralis TaxID=516702 RepID=UPI003B43C919